MRRVAAVVLAAGASIRLGKPKQLVKIGDENLLERSVRIAREATLSPIVVVLGAAADLIQANSNLDGAQIIVNDGWREGMASSIRAGIEVLRDVDAAVLMVCDMPAVTAEHLRDLAVSGEITGSFYAGRKGVPAYIPKSTFPILLRLQGDSGARDLLHTAQSIELAGGEFDIDSEDDVTIAQQRFGSQP